ncbi:unnamed protein product [Arctia plantaginis]|uniref:Uncharacterized protein n=1 Tax=Arctia plantaginis TaxID=874455 RepID=A0A8S0ZH96_ARCPL|nr:unnamed protein product [Arctia plantaginis]CAB3242710.1 unnamed protein product [Arctia plantaginis]
MRHTRRVRTKRSGMTYHIGHDQSAYSSRSRDYIGQGVIVHWKGFILDSSGRVSSLGSAIEKICIERRRKVAVEYYTSAN